MSVKYLRVRLTVLDESSLLRFQNRSEESRKEGFNGFIIVRTPFSVDVYGIDTRFEQTCSDISVKCKGSFLFRCCSQGLV